MQEIIQEDNFISNYIVKHSDSIKRYATQLTYPHHEIADDLFQETAYHCLRSSHSYIHQDATEAWIKTIMRNIYINELKSAYHRNTYFTEHFSDSEDEVSTDTTVSIDDLYHAIEHLNPDEKVIITMRLQGYSYDEIATTTHKKIGTIKSSIHRIKARLRVLLRQK